MTKEEREKYELEFSAKLRHGPKDEWLAKHPEKTEQDWLYADRPKVNYLERKQHTAQAIKAARLAESISVVVGGFIYYVILPAILAFAVVLLNPNTAYISAFWGSVILFLLLHFLILVVKRV